MHVSFFFLVFWLAFELGVVLYCTVKYIRTLFPFFLSIVKLLYSEFVLVSHYWFMVVQELNSDFRIGVDSISIIVSQL